MKAWHGAVSIVLVWAGIYLPALGEFEYKGEEPRRVQPAIAMLDSGNWLVPHIGGEVYYKKPPIINWAIAGAFTICNARNEFAARLPSVLGVLAMALVLGLLLRRWLSPGGAFCAALFFLTHIAMMEKGRLAEIEALYVTEFGIAISLWLNAFLQNKGNVALWLLPWLLLAVGVLTKGPPHLLFFYGIVVAVLWRSREMKRLWSIGHVLGIGAGLAVIAAWVIPFFVATSGGKALSTYYNQMAIRVAGETDQLQSWEWLLNLPKALGNFLPWTVLLPLLWWRPLTRVFNDREQAIFFGARDATTLLYVAIGVLPGVAPRYLMPLLVVPCVLLAWVLSKNAAGVEKILTGWRVAALLISLGVAAGFIAGGFVSPAFHRGYAVAGTILLVAIGFVFWKWWSLLKTPASLALLTGVLMVVLAFAYAAYAPSLVRTRDNVRPVGMLINSEMASGDVLVAVDPGSRPFIAYLAPGLRFAQTFKQIPPETTLLLFASSKLERAQQAGIRGEEIVRVRDRDKEEFILWRISPATRGSP